MLITDPVELSQRAEKWGRKAFPLNPDILSIWESPEDDWHLYTTATPDSKTPYFLLDAEERHPEWSVWVYPEMPEDTRERLMLLLKVLLMAKPGYAQDLGTDFWHLVSQPARWMVESEEFQSLGLSSGGNLIPTYAGSEGFEAVRRVLLLPEGAGAERWFLDVRNVQKILSQHRERLVNTLGHRPPYYQILPPNP